MGVDVFSHVAYCVKPPWWEGERVFVEVVGEWLPSPFGSTLETLLKNEGPLRPTKDKVCWSCVWGVDWNVFSYVCGVIDS